MKNLSIILALVLVAGAAAARQWVPFAPGASERAAQYTVVSSNSQRTVIELELSGLYVEPVAADGQTWQAIDFGMAGGGLLTEVGSPQLPLVARLVAIPGDKNVAVRVVESDEVTLAGYRVYPTQRPQPENQPALPFVIDAKRYATDAFYPAANWRASDPMIMRDFRVVQLVLQPARFNPLTGELRVTRRLRVELIYSGYSTVNVKTTRRPHISRAFEPLYRSFIANYDFVRPPQRAEDGSYVIIVNDAFASAVAPFAAWKERKGWRTKVVTTTEIGGIDTAHVDAYIANAYNTWPYPPDYVLLVGDAPEYVDCCHWPGRTDASDLKYSLQEGGDILADLMISRACVRTLAEAEAVMNKLYKYEKDPYMANTRWFGRVVSLAGYEGNPRFWSMVIRTRNYVMGRPFTQFDTLFERWNLNTATNLTESLNQGRSWMLYRGHGLEQGWANVSPSWSNSSVLALNNGRMVPCVIGPTCLSGDFDYASGDCHAEAWVKAGEEKGGCGYFGASEVSYSGYNDSLATGSFLSYSDSLQYTFAQCTWFGKLFMLQAYPLPDQITEEEMYMFNNFGEPELNVWSAVPRLLTVDHPATVLIGSFPFQVTVNANDAPVAGALVCVMSAVDSTIYHVAHTDGSGQVQFTLHATQPGDSIYVTVTGRNLYPYQGAAMTIAPNSAYITYLRSTVNDSAGGNGDGIINPGETIRLPLWVKNWGSVAANSVTAKLRTSDPGIGITDSVKSFGNIGAGDSAWTGANGFAFRVAEACTNGYGLRFQLQCRDANDSVWNSGLSLWVGTPVLGYVGQTVDDPPPGGNGDGKVDPGETAQLMVTMRNLGLGHGYNVAARLHSGDARFRVTDSTGAYGFIPFDTIAVNTADPFTVVADESIPREAVIPCTLFVTADGGYRKALPFTVTVGEIRAVDPIPDGPRQPAFYWAYDDVDARYRQRPTYGWVELNGVGTRLTLSDDQTVVVSLPSGFGQLRYYGQNYTQVSICGNGWVAPGSTTLSAYSNTGLPSTSLSVPAVCLDWDDLYPPTGNGVWYYHDTANHRFVVEYDSVAYYSSRTVLEKFEVIFYDGTVPSPSGDNVIDVQYKTAQGFTSSTVGIQDPTRSIAIQYLYDGSYHRGAARIAAGRAIRYITGDPSSGVVEPGTRLAAAVDARLAVAPNPVRSRALVRFGLANAVPVRLLAYDRTGRRVATLLDRELKPGSYSVAWSGKDDAGRRLAQGVYFLKLETGTELQTVKTLLVQ